jgi:hypothetical protein
VAGYLVRVPFADALWLRRRVGAQAELSSELSHALGEARRGREYPAVEITGADVAPLSRVLLPPPLAPLSEPLRHLRYAVKRRLSG